MDLRRSRCCRRCHERPVSGRVAVLCASSVLSCALCVRVSGRVAVLSSPVVSCPVVRPVCPCVWPCRCPVQSCRVLSCRAPCVSVCLAVSRSFEPPVPCECDAGSCSRTAPSRPREQETTAEARDIGDFCRRGQSSRTPSLVCVCHVCPVCPCVWPCLTPTRQLASPTIASAIVVSTRAPVPTRLFTPLRELDVS